MPRKTQEVGWIVWKKSLLVLENQENICRIIKDLRAVATRACPPSTSPRVYSFPSPQKILPLCLNFSHTCALWNSFLATLQESIFISNTTRAGILLILYTSVFLMPNRVWECQSQSKCSINMCCVHRYLRKIIRVFGEIITKEPHKITLPQDCSHVCGLSCGRESGLEKFLF